MHPATLPDTAAQMPCQQLVTARFLQGSRSIQRRVEKDKQEPLEKSGIICQAKPLRKLWGKATKDEGEGKARLGSSHSPPAEAEKKDNAADSVPSRDTNGHISTGSKKLEEKIFYNHNKQLIHLFFFNIWQLFCTALLKGTCVTAQGARSQIHPVALCFQASLWVGRQEENRW